MAKKLLFFSVLISQIITSQVISDTYDFESLTVSSNLNGQDNWVVNTNVTQQNVGNTSSIGDYVGSKAFVPGDLGGSNFLFASRVNDANWEIPSVTSCTVATNLTIEASVAINYWGQHFNLCYDKNGDGDYGSLNVADSNELSVGFGRHRTGGVNYMQVYKADGTTTSVAVAESLASYAWVRFRLVIDLAANSGQGSGTLYYRDLEASGSWTAYPGLGSINMLIDDGSVNQDNLSNLDGVGFVQEADRVYWDDLYVSITCDGLVGVESSQIDLVKIYASHSEIIVDLSALSQADIVVYDMLGRVVSSDLGVRKDNYRTKVSQEGIYIVQVSEGGAVKTQKVLVH